MNEDDELITQSEEAEPVETGEVDIKDTIAEQLDKAEQTATEEKPAIEANKEEAETQPEAEAQEEYKPRFNGYTNHEREVLAKLPADVQKIIDAREEKFHRGVDQFRGGYQAAQAISKTLAPDAQLLQQYNITPVEWINRLVTAERQLRTSDPATKLRTLQGLANDYGIDLQHVSQVPFDQTAYQLQQHNQALQQRLELAQASTQSAEVAQAVEFINEFGASHEYFDELRPIMADLLDKGLAGDLNEAYEKAKRLEPTVFEKWQNSQFERKQQEQAERANQAAKTAKAAAVSLKGGAPIGRSSLPTPATTQDAVRQAMEQLGL